MNVLIGKRQSKESKLSQNIKFKKFTKCSVVHVYNPAISFSTEVISKMTFSLQSRC